MGHFSESKTPIGLSQSRFSLLLFYFSAFSFAGAASAAAAAVVSCFILFIFAVNYPATVKYNCSSYHNGCFHGMSSLQEQHTDTVHNKGYHPCHCQLEHHSLDCPFPAAGFSFDSRQGSGTWCVQQAECH